MRLRLVPERSGTIRIVGLDYILNDVVAARKEFVRRGRRLNETQEQRSNAKPTYASNETFDIQVLPPMPLLDLEWRGVPETILSGEVVKMALEVRNKGKRDLGLLLVHLSHPGFFCFQEPDGADDAPASSYSMF